jgi:hypothetical protein
MPRRWGKTCALETGKSDDEVCPGDSASNVSTRTPSSLASLSTLSQPMTVVSIVPAPPPAPPVERESSGTVVGTTLTPSTTASFSTVLPPPPSPPVGFESSETLVGTIVPPPSPPPLTLPPPPPPPPPPLADDLQQRWALSWHIKDTYRHCYPLPFHDYVNRYGFLTHEHQWGENIFTVMRERFHEIYMKQSRHAWRRMGYVQIGCAYFIQPSPVASQDAAALPLHAQGCFECYRFPTIWIDMPDDTIWIVCIHILENGCGGRAWQVHNDRITDVPPPSRL